MVRDSSLDKVNLALSGGGARGVAHVGVLLELAERGIEIASIVGTSAGSMVGALYAFHRSETYGEIPLKQSQLLAAQKVEEICLSSEFGKFRDVGWLPISWLKKGPIRGDRLESWLSENLWSKRLNRPVRFGDLQFDLTVTATDADKGDEVVINSDTDHSVPLYLAVRASSLVQGLFRDITIDISGEPIRCWDGGTTGNCRFDIALNRNPTLPTIACSLTSISESIPQDTSFLSAIRRPMNIFIRTTEILTRQIEKITFDMLAEDQKKRLIFVRPGFGDVGVLDFSMSVQKKKGLIDSGAAAARGSLDAYLA